MTIKVEQIFCLNHGILHSTAVVIHMRKKLAVSGFSASNRC